MAPLVRHLVDAITQEEQAVGRTKQVLAHAKAAAQTVQTGREQARQSGLITEAEFALKHAKAEREAARQTEAKADAVAFGASLQLTQLSSNVEALEREAETANYELRELRANAKLLKSGLCQSGGPSCALAVAKAVKAKEIQQRVALQTKKRSLVAAKSSQQKLKNELMKLDIISKVNNNIKKAAMARLNIHIEKPNSNIKG